MSVFSVLQDDLDERLRENRRLRYVLQSAAKFILPNERVSFCLRRINGGSVELWSHRKTEKAFYKGLLVCGSVWNCPVCSTKISERRRKELEQAFNAHKEKGGRIAMLTLTFSHKREDVLKDTLKNFTSATSRFRSGKRYQKIRDDMKLIGTIRSFEITYGKNGFHPHVHMALFYEKKVNLKRIKKEMFELWERSCAKYGLITKDKYGLDLQDGQAVEDYLTKSGNWSLDRELSKTHLKKGKENSLTPFDFLREFIETGEVKYKYLFEEYAFALKGKTQLYWSRGLKKMYLIEDKTDEELAKESLEEADLLGLLTYEQWKVILGKDERSRFLDYIEKYGFEYAVEMLIDKYEEMNESSMVCEIKLNKKRKTPTLKM